MAHEPRKKALDFGGSADDVTLRYRVRVSVWLRLPSDTGDNAMGMFTYTRCLMSVTIYLRSAASAEVWAPLSAILVIMAPPHRRHSALMTLSVCLSA